MCRLSAAVSLRLSLCFSARGIGTRRRRRAAPLTPSLPPPPRAVPPKMLFTPETSVRCMLDIIGKATMADTGKLFTWDGSTIDW